MRPYAAFSFTAPVYSEEDEARDKAKLSAEEKAIIQSDVNGFPQGCKGNNLGNKSGILEETVEMIESAERRLAEAMAVLPVERKQEYLEAREVCPELFETESSALRFMRCEAYDECRAAERLAEYWKLRKLVFKDRAFLPMTLDGAIADDIELLRAQPDVIACLPPDLHGRGVVLVNRFRFDPSRYEWMSMVRFCWYILHVALENENVQRNGLVFLSFLDKWTSPYQFDRKSSKILYNSITKAMPIRIRSAHICKFSHLSKCLVRCIMFMAPQHVRYRIVLHLDRTGHSLLRKLQSYGMEPEGLPKEIGGEVDITSSAFLDHREEVEKCRRCN